MKDPVVNVKIHAGIAHVTLSRPDKRNALNMAMFRSLDRVSWQLRKDRTIRVVIVDAEGEDFCSGLDIKSVMRKKSSVLALLAKWWPGNANLAQRVSVNWRRIPAPVIMVIQGRCWGGGMQIALGGDFRFATPDASFSIMEGKWGLVPDMGGNLVLRELARKDVAMRLAMTAEIFDAKTALQLGLVTDVCEEPMAKARELADQIKERSPDAVAAVKRLYHRSWSSSDRVMLARESLYQVRLLLGSNQGRAVRRQLNPDADTPYAGRGRW